jgi:hypothetical protein
MFDIQRLWRIIILYFQSQSCPWAWWLLSALPAQWLQKLSCRIAFILLLVKLQDPFFPTPKTAQSSLSAMKICRTPWSSAHWTLNFHPARNSCSAFQSTLQNVMNANQPCRQHFNDQMTFRFHNRKTSPCVMQHKIINKSDYRIDI